MKSFPIIAVWLAGCGAVPPPPPSPVVRTAPPAPRTEVAAEHEGPAAVSPSPRVDFGEHLGCADTTAIENPRALQHLMRRLDALETRDADDHVRIAMYGDSNLTADQFTGRMRRVLQHAYGDGGHGWVSLSRPWGWYRHEDVRHSGTWPQFRQIATSTHQIRDAHYGLANMAAESTAPGGEAWVATAPEGNDVGTRASRFELFYLKQRGGGALDVRLDGAAVKTLSSNAPDFEAATERIVSNDGAHELRIHTRGGGAVRLFGVTLERETPGIVIDSLGAGALNFEQMAHVRSSTRKPAIARRKWDLVIFQLGTNMFAPRMHKQWARQVLEEMRDAQPEASFLLMSPPDTVESWYSAHSEPRIVTIGQQLRELAQELGIAYWDYREAMGGDAAMLTFMKRGLAEPDRVHLKQEGAYLMADRFLCALRETRGL